MMPRLCLVLVLIALVFSVACGSGSGGGGSTGPFSNASLNGQYVYQINGTDFTLNANGAPYRESGVFSANGAQGITGGIDDFVEGGGGVSTNPLTGSYTINGDGTGSIVLNIAGGTLTFAVTMVSNSKVYLIEADGGVNASGLAEKQDPTAIAAVPSGTFIFRTHILNAALVPTATVGTMTIASSAVSSGNEDSITLGATSTPLNLTGGAFTAPDSNGRGQFNLNNSTPATTGFFYYIVDANNIRFFDSDLGFTGLGTAEKQTAGPTFTGSYAFGTRGDTTTNNFGLGGVNTAGRFTSDGTSALSAGVLDTVQGGNQASNVTFTGTFTPVDSKGRTAVTFSTTAQLVCWMVNSSRAFVVFNDPAKVEDGTFDSQLGSGFSNSSMNGSFGFAMDGYGPLGVVGITFINRVGTLQWNGSGGLTLNEAANSGSGAISPGNLSGNYTVSANGRVQATINNLSIANGDIIFYMISPNDAYVLQTDPGVEIFGTVSKQPAN